MTINWGEPQFSHSVAITCTNCNSDRWRSLAPRYSTIINWITDAWANGGRYVINVDRDSSSRHREFNYSNGAPSTWTGYTSGYCWKLIGRRNSRVRLATKLISKGNTPERSSNGRFIYSISELKKRNHCFIRSGGQFEVGGTFFLGPKCW